MSSNNSEFSRYFETIHGLLRNENPVKALNELKQLSEKISFILGKHRHQEFDYLPVYLYYAAAYEQLKDKTNAMYYLKKIIDMIELKLNNYQESNGKESYSELIEVLASVYKRMAITQESSVTEPKVAGLSWLKTAKAFDAISSRLNAASSSLRAVRWFITAKDTKLAIKTLSWAFSLTESLQHNQLQGLLYNELGIAFMAFELVENGIICFETANHRFMKRGSSVKASSLQNLGSAYAVAKQFHKAVTTLQESIEYYKNAGNRAGQAQANCNLAYAFACMGHLRKARWCYTLAREAAKDAGWVAVQQQAEQALTVLEFVELKGRDFEIDYAPSYALCPSVAASQVEEVDQSEFLQMRFLKKFPQSNRKQTEPGRGKSRQVMGNTPFSPISLNDTLSQLQSTKLFGINAPLTPARSPVISGLMGWRHASIKLDKIMSFSTGQESPLLENPNIFSEKSSNHSSKMQWISNTDVVEQESEQLPKTRLIESYIPPITTSKFSRKKLQSFTGADSHGDGEVSSSALPDIQRRIDCHYYDVLNQSESEWEKLVSSPDPQHSDNLDEDKPLRHKQESTKFVASGVGDMQESSLELLANHYAFRPPPIVQSIGDIDQLPPSQNLLQLDSRLEHLSNNLLLIDCYENESPPMATGDSNSPTKIHPQIEKQPVNVNTTWKSFLDVSTQICPAQNMHEAAYASKAEKRRHKLLRIRSKQLYRRRDRIGRMYRTAVDLDSSDSELKLQNGESQANGFERPENAMHSLLTNSKPIANMCSETTQIVEEYEDSSIIMPTFLDNQNINIDPAFPENESWMTECFNVLKSEDQNVAVRNAVYEVDNESVPIVSSESTNGETVRTTTLACSLM